MTSRRSRRPPPALGGIITQPFQHERRGGNAEDAPLGHGYGGGGSGNSEITAGGVKGADKQARGGKTTIQMGGVIGMMTTMMW